MTSETPPALSELSPKALAKAPATMKLRNPVRSLIGRGIRVLRSSDAERAALTLADQAVASGCNFLTAIIVGRTLGKEQFGLYILGFSVLLILSNLQTSLISWPLTVFAPRLEEHPLRIYRGSTLAHHVLFAALATGGLIVAAPILSRTRGLEEVRAVIWSLAPVMVAILAREYVRRLCFAELRIKRALALDCCLAVIQISGLLGLASAGVLTVRSAFWVIGTAWGTTSLVSLLMMRDAFTFRFSQLKGDFLHNWKMGRWLTASTLGSSVTTELYPWLLAIFHGVSETGAFAACRSLFSVLNVGLEGLTNLLIPMAAQTYSRMGRKELVATVIRAVGAIGVGMAIFTVGTVFLGTWVVTLLYGKAFGGYQIELVLLALTASASAVCLPINSALMATERADALFKSYLLSSAVTLAAGIPLVRQYSIKAAVVALLVSNIAGVAYRAAAFWADSVAEMKRHEAEEIGQARTSK